MADPMIFQFIGDSINNQLDGYVNVVASNTMSMIATTAVVAGGLYYATMGLLMAQLAPRAGAASVTIVDTNPSRLDVAREIGIENIYGSADEADRDKWDVAIDCTGVVRAIEDGLPRVKAGGTFQHFGVAPTDATANYSPFRVYRDEISIVGTMAVLNSFGRAVEMFEAGAIQPTPMISHSFTLDDYADALDMFRKGTGRKLQIRPNDTESRTLHT